MLVKSHLLQMRGLKPKYESTDPEFIESHLLQMRGLKHILDRIMNQIISRIFYRCVD